LIYRKNKKSISEERTNGLASHDTERELTDFTSPVSARKTGISGNINLSLDTNVSAGFVQVGFENFSALLQLKQSTQPHPNGNITDGATDTILAGGGKC